MARLQSWGLGFLQSYLDQPEGSPDGPAVLPDLVCHVLSVQRAACRATWQRKSSRSQDDGRCLQEELQRAWACSSSCASAG